VAEANQKLYINRAEGFIGTGLKKDEFVCNCSDIDDIILFYKDGKYKVIRVADKIFVGKNIIHVQVWKKNDLRTTYNMVYRDGKQGNYYVKRFNVTGMTRDKEYDLTMGTAGSKVHYFTANPNGEAEVIKVTLEPNVKLKKIFIDYDFSTLAVKGRASRGNLLTKNTIHRISLKSHGHSTLGGQKVWYDPDVNRLNHTEHGQLLGEFTDDDQILVILSDGDFYVTTPNVDNHFEQNVKRIEKFDPDKVYTCVLFDKDNKNLPYIKRFKLDKATKNHHNYLGNPQSEEVLLTDTVYPRLLVTFGGADAFRPQMEIDAEQFIGIKGYDARGKRLATWEVAKVEELEPLRFPDPTDDSSDDKEEDKEENLDPDADKSEQQVRDELTGQTSLDFGDE
jgi:topoisomerase-4 subunit A